jgi:peptidoglycan-associated lipoprotein
MQKVRNTLGAFLCLVLASVAQSQGLPKDVSVRYSEQVSNGPAGTCGCFSLEGAAGDSYWAVQLYKEGKPAYLGFVADVGVEHTGNINNAGYGLTLTTVTAGPRAVLLPIGKVRPFAQVLLGLAHGSSSQFPQNNGLVASANSFALDLGAGADYTVSKRLSVRLLQLDYVRTALPNNSTDWQNNLRIGTGIVLHF